MTFVSISSFLNYIFPLNTFILYNFAQKERNMIIVRFFLREGNLVNILNPQRNKPTRLSWDTPFVWERYLAA